MATVIPEFKVILCGEFGAGKTSLFRRFMNNSFIDTSQMSLSESRASNVGLDHFTRRMECNGKAIKIQLWDTGGLERVASMTNSYYKFAEAALLVFALNSMESFHYLCQPLVEILSMAENAKIFLIGNKSDCDAAEVTDDIVDQFIEQFPCIDGYFKLSCRTGAGIEDMISEVTHVLSASSCRFRETYDAFTLHGRHTSGDCCTNHDSSHGTHHDADPGSGDNAGQRQWRRALLCQIVRSNIPDGDRHEAQKVWSLGLYYRTECHKCAIFMRRL